MAKKGSKLRRAFRQVFRPSRDDASKTKDYTAQADTFMSQGGSFPLDNSQRIYSMESIESALESAGYKLNVVNTEVLEETPYNIPMKRLRQKQSPVSSFSPPSANKKALFDNFNLGTSSSRYTDESPQSQKPSHARFGVQEHILEKFLCRFQTKYQAFDYWDLFSKTLILHFFNPYQITKPLEVSAFRSKAAEPLQSIEMIVHEINNVVANCYKYHEEGKRKRGAISGNMSGGDEFAANFKLEFVVEKGASPIFSVAFNIAVENDIKRWKISYAYRRLEIPEKNVTYQVEDHVPTSQVLKMLLKPLQVHRVDPERPWVLESTFQRAVRPGLHLDQNKVNCIKRCWSTIIDMAILDGDNNINDRLLNKTANSLAASLERQRHPSISLIDL